MKLDTSRTVLVVDGTDPLSSAVISALLDIGAPVRALVASADAASRLPVDVTPMHGDLRNPASVERALHGAHAAFYVAPDAADTAAVTDPFVRACESSDTRIVFAGIDIGDGWWARVASRLRTGAQNPRRSGTFLAAQRIRRSGARPVLLALTPSAHREQAAVAAAAVRALLEPGFPSGVYRIAPLSTSDRSYLRDVAARPRKGLA